MKLIRTITYEQSPEYVDEVLDVTYDELRPDDSLESRWSAYHNEYIKDIRPFSIRFSRSGWVNRAYVETLPGTSIRIFRRVYR